MTATSGHDDPPVEGGYTGMPRKRSCNLHADCDAADAAAKEILGKRRPIHCHAEDCEECFGC